MSHYLGIDVGGTKTEVCLVQLQDPSQFQSYQIVGRERMDTLRAKGLSSFLSRLNELTKATIDKSSLTISELKGIGIGLPGSINPKSQILAAGSIPFLKDIPLNSVFKEALSFTKTIAFDNDANCFALAEAYLGAGFEWSKLNQIPSDELCMIGVTLGTGVGGGLLINGELIRGSRGGAGEIGHMTLIESGHACYCGKYGCSEQYLSGTAFEASYASRADRLESKSSKEIFKLIEEGHPLAIATLEHYRDHLVTFLSNLSNLLDPHVIVLGGGMSTQSRIYSKLEERLSEGCFLTKDPPAVLANLRGDSAGVLGAALLSFGKGIAHHEF